jgi:acetyl-CoA acyltransferase
MAGGAESLSNVPIRFSDEAAHVFMALAKARTLPEKAKLLARLSPKSLAPVAPAIAEYTTGMTMGESGEKMAKENDISRRAQDEVALWSHQRAAAAQADGRFDDQVVATFPPPRYDEAVTFDTGVRQDTSYEAMSQLKPVFDKRYGTLTAGNSSPLTDGGAAVLLMSEDKAKALGYTPLARIASWSYVGVDPADQLLMGPAIAMPTALDRAGLTLADMDLIDMHEAFAAQVLSVLKMLASDAFAKTRLGRDKAVGEVDPARLNVHGGSVALGHPFGATGARMITTMANELHETGKQHALLGICAAGGLGAAAVLERV